MVPTTGMHGRSVTGRSPRDHAAGRPDIRTGSAAPSCSHARLIERRDRASIVLSEEVERRPDWTPEARWSRPVAAWGRATAIDADA
jgi:hypothetical protein